MGAEIRVLFAAISKKLEGVHMGFLIQVTVKTAKQQRDWTFINTAVDGVLK